VKLYRFVIGVTAALLLLAVNIRSAGQQPADTRQAADNRGAAAPAASPTAAATRAPTEDEFQAVTSSLLNNTCGECHNSFEVAADLDLTQEYTAQSLHTDRDLWDVILDKLKSREMPPIDVPRPEAEIAALITFLEAEFERADALVPPDPGRVTARRLNRTEYTNTIRDLLAIEFRADRTFPTDDSGDGFDNIGDILTVSPVLMEAYLNAAERIAASAIASEPLPEPIARTRPAKPPRARSAGDDLRRPWGAPVKTRDSFGPGQRSTRRPRDK